MDSLFLEATLEATTEKTGKEWEVTIIGARGSEGLVTVGGKEYVKSKNGRLYLVDALKESAPMWEGVKVYDNHMTQAEFESKQGMRSPSNEWLGTIVKPRWDAATRRLIGVFKVVEDSLVRKLKNAYDQNVLGTIGLSIDTFPVMGEEVMYENQRTPVIEGFRKILSVDLVGNPAAGGAFERILAAEDITQRGANMDQVMKDEIRAIVAELLPQQQEATTEDEIKAIVAETLAEALKDEDVPTDDSPDEIPAAIAEAIQEAKLAKAELVLTRALEAAKLTAKHEEVVTAQYGGKVFEESELKGLIKTLKEAEADTDPTGRVQESGGQRGADMQVFDEADNLAMQFMYKFGGRAIMGLDSHEDDRVQERVQESEAYQAWVKQGRPNVRFDGRMSELLRGGYLGGGWSLEDVNYQEASTLATVIKNTVNIMTAVDYAGQNRWYEQLVDIEESDNPIDDFTFARLFGTDTLDVVAKGAAYTEMDLSDEEETASHVKQGNYIPVHLEDLMADKINFYRTIPSRLSNSWVNTLSAKVAAVFTTNSAAGPVLSDTGALFNATAVGTGGGHANLLTTALSYSAYDAVMTAMYKQTDQPLGAGRKLVDMGPFYLLVPIDLHTTANEIVNSRLVPGQSGGATTGGEFQTVNRFGPEGTERPTVIKVPEWTDADNWAVVGRYRGKSPIKLVFPMGMRTPQIYTSDSEQAGTMFTNDTIRYKVRMMTYRFSSTYDCAPVVDWRTIHKSNV